MWKGEDFRGWLAALGSLSFLGGDSLRHGLGGLAARGKSKLLGVGWDLTLFALLL